MIDFNWNVIKAENLNFPKGLECLILSRTEPKTENMTIGELLLE